MDVGQTVGKGLGCSRRTAGGVGSFFSAGRVSFMRKASYRGEVRADAIDGEKCWRIGSRAGARTSVAFGGATLGVVRFSCTALVAVPAPGAPGDLYPAPIRHLWQLPIAAQLTDAHDFLANTYFTIARSRVAGLGLVELRLVPETLAAEALWPSAALPAEELNGLIARPSRGRRCSTSSCDRSRPRLRERAGDLTLTGRANVDGEQGAAVQPVPR